MTIFTSKDNTEKLEELVMLVKSCYDEQVFKNIDKESYPLNHTWPDLQTFIHKAVLWKNPVALQYFLECFKEGFINSKILEHNKDNLYYYCINQATGKMDRSFAKILSEYIPLKDSWGIVNVFETLFKNDMKGIGFLISNGISLLPDYEYNKNQGMVSDHSGYRGLVSNLSIPIEMYNYLEYNKFCVWNDDFLNEPVLYYILNGADVSEIQENSQEFALLKEKMVYFIEKGCCLDASLISNRYNQTATVGEYFLELIDIDIQDSENKEAFMAMFTELKVHYEKQKIKKILNDNSEQSVKVKRL